MSHPFEPSAGEQPALRGYADPLDLLDAEHRELRGICASLERMAGTDHADPETAQALAARIRSILPCHVADEEVDLFPLLRSCAAPEDDIDAVLGRLAAEHEAGVARVPAILRLLDRLAFGDSGLDAEDRQTLAAYAGAKLRHLILETAVVLPIARQRLDAWQRSRLAAAMAARRAAPASA
jgi:hemerythrin-like domain-containing protein